MKKYIIVFVLILVSIIAIGVSKIVLAVNNSNLDYDHLIGGLLKHNTGVVSDLSDGEKELLVDEMQNRDIYPDMPTEDCDKQSKQKDGELDFNYYINEIVVGNGEIMNEICIDEQRLLGNEIKKQLDSGTLYYGEHSELLRK